MTATGQRLQDKVAIVTGGAQGIGHAYAIGLSDEGAKVAIADMNFEKAMSTAGEIEDRGGAALALRTDVSQWESTEEMAKRTVEKFGRIDILINNAAILGKVNISRVPFYELDLHEWDKVLAVNLTGVLLCCRAVFPQMKLQKSGKIINITSPSWNVGHANYLHYVASKAGVVGLTRSMARELGDYNINVNCIGPGATMAEDPNDQAAVEARTKRVSARAVPKRCFKRVQYPEDLVGTVLFLASADSAFVTGQTIVCDGGDFMN